MDRAHYDAQTVPQLREELGKRELDTTGNKPDLVDRLVGDDYEKAKAAAEAQTSDELSEELRERDLPVSGSKDEKVERLVADETGAEPEPELSGKREQREVLAGGHTILVDVDPETPKPMDTCSVCGAELGTCVHSQEAYGRAWGVAEPAPPAPASETHWPDETVGPRSMVGDDTPDPDVKAAEEISEAITEEE